MNKWIAILLSLSLLALAGCGANGTPEVQTWETSPAATTEARSETTIPEEAESQAENVDLTAFTRENPYNKTSQVGVYAPMVTEVGTYTLDYIDISREDAFHALRPEDHSALHAAEEHGYHRLHSDSGMTLTAEKSYLSLGFEYEGEFQQQSQIFTEIEGLLQWKLDHGETDSPELPFATKKQVQEQCEGAMTALGLGLEPELMDCIGMTHQEARQYQQHLLKTDETYDCFGKVYELPELDDSFDCYYLTYSFRWDGIPVYGCDWFPYISRSDVADRYQWASAQFLVSADGIQDCVIYGGFGKPRLQEKQPVLSAEEAARIACQELDADMSQFTPDRDHRIEYVSFCLAPMYDDASGSYQLTPMWGAEMSFRAEKSWVYSYTGGEIFLDGITGDRIC